MPKLTSGRMVGVGQLNLVNKVCMGDEFMIYAVCLAFRLEVPRPEDLLPLLPVVLFDPAKGPPPEGPPTLAGYTVADVLAGCAPGWSDDEIAEFKHWLHTDAAVGNWARQHHHDMHCAIRDSPIWTSEWLTGEPWHGTLH